MAVRRAVRVGLSDLPRGALVLVACSGGPDSCALALAVAAVGGRRGLRVGLVTVDHGTDGLSSARGAAAAALGRALGLDPVVAVRVEVPQRGAGGPEAAARDLRHAALGSEAQRSGASAVLLGHVREDQAETVLLRLARGSGARSLAGMPARRGLLRRPLLDLPRELVHACLRDLPPLPDVPGLPGGLPARDPANTDERLARARVRARVLPALCGALGEAAVLGLVRTAGLLRDDADLLDALAAEARARLAEQADAGGGLPAAGVAALPAALRRRVLRTVAVDAGCPADAVRRLHVQALEQLVARRGSGPVALPGGRAAHVASGTLRLEADPAQAEAARRRRARGSCVPDAAPGTGAADGGGTVTTDLAPHPDVERVLVSADEIAVRVQEMAAQVADDLRERLEADGRPLLLVGVLKGALMVMADLARALPVDTELDFMAVSSYGSSTSSSGVVRILKDLDGPVEGRHVLVVEDILDSGRTLSWLVGNLSSRAPASLDVLALLRKPASVSQPVEVRYVGFDLPPDFVVGYGLDHAGRYRDLPYVGLLRREAYAGR